MGLTIKFLDQDVWLELIKKISQVAFTNSFATLILTRFKLVNLNSNRHLIVE